MDGLVRATTEETNMVNTYITKLNQDYLATEREIHALRKLRFMKGRTNAPKAFQRIVGSGLRSPMSYRLVQTVTGMITKERPAYKRLPIDNDDRDSASRLQASADPLMQDLERLAHKPLYSNFVDALVADGRATMKLYNDIWDGYPLPAEGEPDEKYNQRVAKFVMQGATHPLRMRMVDALNFKVPLVDYEPPYVMEGGKRQLLDVMDAYGLQFATNNDIVVRPNSTAFHVLELPTGVSPVVDVEELWFDDCCFVRVAGKVFCVPNELGFKPYVWASGETTSHPDPALASLSILYPIAGVEPWLNTMMTVMAGWGVIAGTPTMYTSRKVTPGAAGVPDVPPNVTDLPLGKRVDLGIGGEMGFLNPPPVGAEVMQFVNFLVDFMDRAGLPPIAYGNMGSRTPGTAFQSALEQAVARLNPIVTSAETAFAEIVKMHWRIIEHIGKPMVVTGVGVQPKDIFKRKKLGRFMVSPSDIHGYYDLHAHIKVISSQDAISRGMHAAFMRDKKLWSRDRAMEYSDVEDPFEEYKNIMRDTLEESPFVMQQMLEKALQQEPELAQRAESLKAQGVDVGSLLLGLQPGASAKGAPVAGVNPSQAGTQPAGTAPAPTRGGKPVGSPKRAGGNRGGAAQGSRGHR